MISSPLSKAARFPYGASTLIYFRSGLEAYVSTWQGKKPPLSLPSRELDPRRQRREGLSQGK